MELQGDHDHDLWFRSKVRGTLARIARGEDELLTHDEVFAELRAFAAELDAAQDAGIAHRGQRTR